MSSLESRPYIGNWVPNKTLVRHAPDGFVQINGYQEFATCPICKQTLDMQKYITNISADATTEAIANANFSVRIPQADYDHFVKDGVPILHNSLEVVIFMRGYFPMKDFGGLGQDLDPDYSGVDPNDVPLYPYYQVFRGLITGVTHDFSGGYYSATVQCANFLHFWQNLHVAVNGAVYGVRPQGSMVQPTIMSHKFSQMNPYEIIYTLVKVTFGAAYGVNYVLDQSSDIAALDDSNSRSQFAHAMDWWAKRFTENSGNLRMYGVDGSIFNAFEQAFIGAWSSVSENDFYKSTSNIYEALNEYQNLKPLSSKKTIVKLRERLYDRFSTVAETTATEGGKQAVEDLLKMQVYCIDLSKDGGNISLFDTEYMTKLQVVDAVKAMTGFEFYQDVDGDLVYKPPMYNMDTRDDPVYVIKDRDLISISESESEPQATMIKGTGSHFANVVSTGTEGFTGVGAVFIDYRLVAKYGYREETFEANYFTSRISIYISAMNRLDLANVGMHTASISIPLRPEMRAGYPVYVESLDSFFYVKSISHSIAFGSQCTSTINGIAKRSKWYPPMDAPHDGKLPEVKSMRLDAPGEYPQQPLYSYPEYLPGATAGSSGPPVYVGIPNVVLALDPDKINFDTVDIPRNLLSLDGFLSLAISANVLERLPSDENTFILRSGPMTGQTVSLAQLQNEYNQIDQTLAEGQTPSPSTALGTVLARLDEIYGIISTSDAKALTNYLALQASLKSYFAPGLSISGRYRYYSSHIADESQQAPLNYSQDENDKYTTIASPLTGVKCLQLTDVGGGLGVTFKEGDVKRGVVVSQLSQKSPGPTANKTVTVPTSAIRFVTFGPQYRRKYLQVSEVRTGWNRGANFQLPPDATKAAFKYMLLTNSVTELTPFETFSGAYAEILSAIDTYSDNLFTVGGPMPANIPKLRATTANYITRFKSQKPGQDITGIATQLASMLWAYVFAVQNAVIKNLKLKTTAGRVSTEERYELSLVSKDYDQIMSYRADFINTYTRMQVSVPDASPGLAYVPTNEVFDKTSWSPIFPVTDNGGYEVFGNLPYGRGITIEKFSDLLQTGGQNSILTSIQGYSGVNASTMEAIEQFLVAWTAADGNIDPLTILNNEKLYSPTDKARLLADLSATDENINGIVETLFNKDISPAAKVRNTPVTSFSRGQSVTGDVAATNLTNLTVGAGECSCAKGNRSFLLAAYSSEFVELYDGDPVNSWLAEQVIAPKGDLRAYTRQVLSGQVASKPNLENPVTTFTQNVQGAKEQIADLAKKGNSNA